VSEREREREREREGQKKIRKALITLRLVLINVWGDFAISNEFDKRLFGLLVGGT
jgi:hypothetical protein